MVAMQNNKILTASPSELELLNQFGINKDVQIKLCKLKFDTFKAVTGINGGNEHKHLTLKLEALPSTQINFENCLKTTKRLQCSQCSYVCKHSSSLKSHAFKHLTGKPKPFKCELCEYSVGNKTGLVTHIRTHTWEKPFECVLCARTFVTEYALQGHIRTHTGEKFHLCQFCKKQFLENSDKNKHEQICKINPKQTDQKWVETQKKFKCTFCSYSVISKYRLKDHLKTHTDEKEFECKLCSSKYKSRSGLQQHIRSDTGEKPFSCQFCKRLFAQLGHRNSHEQICEFNPKRSDKEYVGLVNKFECHECSYFCRTKGDFNKHLSAHTGEKKFACPLCNYKSRSNGALHRHIRTHTKEKPFKCPHCEFASGVQSNLKKHVNSCHYEGVRRKNFSCEICSRSYFTKQELTRHMLSHTGERPHACK